MCDSPGSDQSKSTGLEQGLNALPSSWHKKLTPASVSVKPKLALISFVGLAGVEVMSGVGGNGLGGSRATMAVCHPIGESYWKSPV